VKQTDEAVSIDMQFSNRLTDSRCYTEDGRHYIESHSWLPASRLLVVVYCMIWRVLSPSWPKCVSQLAVARMVCRPLVCHAVGVSLRRPWWPDTR